MSSVGPSAASPSPPDIPEAKSSSTVDVPKPRTLILCFDGTAEQYDGDNTNVVKFYSLLKKDDDNDEQLCYYQPGVGTYFNPGVVSPLFQWAAKILDEAFAWYLDAHVRGGYQFLMQNYTAGDRICLFGFSRGAYTARALAGMLHKIGLLPRDNTEQIPFAYKLYKQTDKGSLELAAGFKQTFCRNVDIEFVGVWETVSSVGVLMTRTLPFTTANTTIKTFRHALALDEHRVRFLPNFYHRATPAEQSAAKHRAFSTNGLAQHHQGEARTASEQTTTTMEEGKRKSKKSLLPRLFGKSRRYAVKVEKAKLQQDHARAEVREGITPTSASPLRLAENALGDKIDGGTDVLEVWFAGCHADVGGGAVADDVTVSLSDITLRWMVREVVLAQCGIAFDDAALLRANIPESIFRGTGFVLPSQAEISRNQRHHGFTIHDDVAASSSVTATTDTQDPPSTADPAPKTSPGSSGGSSTDPLDASADALTPIHDQLQITKSWWLLEIIPTSCTYQDAAGNWKTKWWIHLGRGRDIPTDAPPKFHVTVRERMQDTTLKYTPKAKWTPGTEVYVD
ncbi:hypothetical protein GY45DRAFT_1244065 [Cubamyces sp. BRFM 1775]|nr:hypothetical protein GY45DRAFT_1244065 [Cubamyces sp. BRFM 1775]